MRCGRTPSDRYSCLGLQTLETSGLSGVEDLSIPTLAYPKNEAAGQVSPADSMIVQPWLLEVKGVRGTCNRTLKDYFSEKLNVVLYG